MIDTPKTLKEAKAYRYGQWAGKPNGIPYKEGKCAYETYQNMIGRQCSRKAKYGPDELYCKQHLDKI